MTTVARLLRLGAGLHLGIAAGCALTAQWQLFPAAVVGALTAWVTATGFERVDE